MSSTPFRQRLALQVLAKRNRINDAGAKGFTLIELLVVIVILGVLGGVGYGAYLAQIAKANEGAATTAATAAAKSCAALRATGDEDNWVPGVDGTRVTLTGTCPPDNSAQTFTATAGTTPNLQTCTADLDGNGAVTPGTCTQS